MNGFYQYILFTVFLAIIIIIFISNRTKRDLQPMQKMIIAMTLSMNISITMGVVLGTIFQGDLFSSTLYSIFAGIAAGILCGAVFGLLSALEGAMTGLMGGMMGAMLGEMIPVAQASIMLMYLLTFSLSSILLFFIFKLDTKIANAKWLMKPMITAILIAAYLLYGFHLNKEVVYHREKKPHQEEHTHSE